MAQIRFVVAFSTFYLLSATLAHRSSVHRKVKANVVLIKNDVLSGQASEGDHVIGTLDFEQTIGHRSVRDHSVNGTLTGLITGEHGWHIHALGNIVGGCGSTGGHFNPANKTHGAPSALNRHVGDLGNLVADEDGVANVEFSDHRIQLLGEASIVGRALVIHAGRDDLGLGGDDESLKTGNAGGRVACGVIGIASADFSP